MKTIRWGAVWVVLLGIGPVFTARAQPERAGVTGVITDARDNQPIAGANVVLQTAEGDQAAEERRTVHGTATDRAGRYQLTGIAPGRYVLVISFVGYEEVTVALTLSSSEQRTMHAALVPGVALDPVVVTASRRAEKAIDAPASVSVLSAREIESDAAVSPVDVLRTTPAVDIAQTGIDRREVALRGFNNAFSGAVYVLTDYRKSAIASLAVNAYNMMPISNIDLDRIEVVRGPGSALYGPGVDEGVVHFITKDPFTSPGTAVAVSGGNQAYVGGQLRHAGVIGGRVGYKIAGLYSRAEDWPLDPDDPHDQEQTATYFDEIPRNDEVRKGYLSGTLAYQFRPNTLLTANGGWATSTSPFLSRIGTLQSDGFGYGYGQLRLQSGMFFAQAYLNKNHAGDSFVYASQAASLSGARVVDESSLFKTEAQYGFDLLEGRAQLTVGADFEQTTPVTEGTITGRNEEDDVIRQYGVYAQSETKLFEGLALTLASRLDYDNIFETLQLSPRAGLVFKLAPLHSVRATYNRAISTPSINTQFLDITAQVTPLAAGSPYRLITQARGGGGFTFNTFRSNRAASFLLPVPGFFGQPVSLDAVPLVPLYGAAASGLVSFLQSPASLPDPLPPLTPEMRNALADLLGYTAQQGLLGPGVTTDAVQLGVPDDTERGYRSVSGPVDTPLLDQTITQTFELGYKGVVGDRLSLALDGYYAKKENFIGSLSVEAPLAYLQQEGLAQDVGVALGQLFATTDDPAVLQLLNQLGSQGLLPAQVAQILAGLTGGALADTPTAVVQPDQEVLPADTDDAIGGLATYRNFGTVSYFGVDVAAQLYATDRLSLFSNLSLVSDNFFDHEELNEESEDLLLSLNAPRFKVRFGYAYEMPQGLSFNMAGRYTEGFPVRSGPYVGTIENYFVLDAGVGYDFARVALGLRLDVTVQNVLGGDHREFIGAPKIGRLAIARLTYVL